MCTFLYFYLSILVGGGTTVEDVREPKKSYKTLNRRDSKFIAAFGSRFRKCPANTLPIAVKRSGYARF